METLFARLGRYRDERYSIVASENEIEHIRNSYKDPLAEAKLVSREAFARVFFDMNSELEIYEYEIDKIETSQQLRKARKWGVPVPRRPKLPEDNYYWSYRSFIGDHVLTSEGQMYLRREIAFELELFFRPVLSWAAIIISVISLSLAVFS